MKCLPIYWPVYSPNRQFRLDRLWYCLVVLTLWLGCPDLARAQLPFFLRVARQPDNLVPVSGTPNQMQSGVGISKSGAKANLQPPGGSPWIVYSDRNNNITFRSSNGTTPFKKMGFMEAFYVLKERNGYLKLIKYDPALVIGNKFSKRVIPDRKAVVYYGWALKSRFLLANQSSRSSDQRRAQIVSAVLAQPALLTNPEHYLSNDSIRLYMDPSQQALADTRMRLYDLAYVYKLSETRRQALVGRASWFPTDSVKQIMLGWTPIEVLQPIGQRLFIEADTANLSSKPISFYRSVSALLRGGRDSTLINSTFPAVSWDRLGPKFPVLKQYSVKDSQVVLLTNALTPLVEKRQVPVLNVIGQTISNQILPRVRANTANYNLVYVVEGSPAMQPYWGELMNTIQFTITQLSQDTTRTISLQVGSVVYDDYEKSDDSKTLKGKVTLLPLTPNYTSLLSRLSRIAPPPRNRPEAEPKCIRSGVSEALKQFANHPDENNIIILVGINGDVQSIIDGKLIPTALKTIECRLLAFQPFGAPGDIPNNFILHSRELVMEIANRGSDLKKARLVRPDMVTATNEFNLRMGDRNVYQLAYPDRSMVPGWVLFPRKNQALPFKELYAATDSLFQQVSNESQKVTAALEKTFQKLEPQGDRVNPKLSPVYASAGLKLPVSPSTLTRIDEYPYLTRAYTPERLSGGTRWKYIALLPLDEYDGIGRWLDMLSGDDIDPSLYLDRIRLHNRYRQVLNEASLSTRGSVTLDQLLKGLLDLPVANPLFKRIALGDLTSRKQVSDALLNQVLYVLRERRDYFRRIPTFRNSRFASNGRTYYWISEDLFK
ncbi:type VI secretion system protein TssR [Spirosoma foliorum]|uniref:Type VI secretion system protein TssR n=1 Tax=Spirosoma foliorum TaxID=2710596 RepID=A0A7G5GVW8_9BACT|nr:type VI secretion system protein TssR [Spirosoma foliorum]QMW03010.1 type VI secretion system protein TssR [Spirosoma foliorum]